MTDTKRPVIRTRRARSTNPPPITRSISWIMRATEMQPTPPDDLITLPIKEEHLVERSQELGSRWDPRQWRPDELRMHPGKQFAFMELLEFMPNSPLV